jgi:putative membrane protein
MKTKIYLFMAAVCITASSFAQTDPKKSAKKENEKKLEGSMEKESEFAVMAADGGMLEVQAGKLAQSNASSDKVKDLANHMVMDHTQANQELKQLASKKNITLPSQLSDKAQKKYDELSKLQGTEFDKEYAKQMVSDHKKDIELFEKEAEKGKDTELKNWAASKQPTLKHHLSMAESTVDALKDTVQK